jgi:hypothetical protein
VTGCAPSANCAGCCPHLYFIERALAHQGSAALPELPVRVLQRGLQQLARLPADNLAERVQFSVLQQRLEEAIDRTAARQHTSARRASQRHRSTAFWAGWTVATHRSPARAGWR